MYDGTICIQVFSGVGDTIFTILSCRPAGFYHGVNMDMDSADADFEAEGFLF